MHSLAGVALIRRATSIPRLAASLGPRAFLSAPPNPPPPPSPAEVAKQIAESEVKVAKIKEGTYKTVAFDTVSDVPDLPTYLPKDLTEGAALADQPDNQRERTVVISQKAQTAMQSAASKSYAWTITWKAQERWSNPLMGWTSTADPMSNVTLFFDTPEQAIKFASKQGWKYELQSAIDRTRDLGKKTYAHNFLSESVEATLKREGVKTKEFIQPGRAASHWFMPLKYHGDGEVAQHGPASSGGGSSKKKK